MQKNFKNIFESKLKGKIETEYVMQEMDSLLDGFKLPEGRTKPWGTAHAVLCAKDYIHEPFAVINADDFYGRDGFEKAEKFLTGEVSPATWCIIGYELSKTLSENGTVSRGVCKVDADGNLISICRAPENLSLKEIKLFMKKMIQKLSCRLILR